MADVLTVRLPDGFEFGLQDMDEKAKQLGLNRTGFALKGLELMMGFDPVFLSKVENYAKGLNIPTWLVMQNMLIKRFAEESAETEVVGSSGRPLHEFMFTSEGPVTGEKLFDILKDMKVHELERLKADVLRKRKNKGIPLKPEDQNFLEHIGG